MRLSVAIVLVIAMTGVAQAYPQFQLAMESACSNCHLSPAGGGLLNDYGRDEAGSTISRGGDGRLLHGLWDPPASFAIGGDFRFAFVGRRQPTHENDLLAFPMQADVNLRVTKGAFAFAFTAGVRGVARDEHPPAFVETLASREHYLAYTTGSKQIRVGRFFPAFGLRLPDHGAYVRRFMGWNTYEEPYAAELAHYGEKTELHVTGFVPQPIPLLGSGLRRSGGAVLVERQVTDEWIAGGQGRVAFSDEDAVFTAGTIAKRWLPSAELLVLAELDLQRQTFRGNGPGRTQLAGYLGASKWATRGVLVSSALHVWEPDLTLRATTRQAFEVAAQYFPWAHVELHLLLRTSAQGGTVEDPSYLSMLQVHYYL